MSNEKRTYDSKCYDLAEHFGTGDPAEQLAEYEMRELACALQETVEDYFQDRRRAEAAYDRSMEEPTYRGGEYAASVAHEMAEARKLK